MCYSFELIGSASPYEGTCFPHGLHPLLSSLPTPLVPLYRQSIPQSLGRYSGQQRQCIDYDGDNTDSDDDPENSQPELLIFTRAPGLDESTRTSQPVSTRQLIFPLSCPDSIPRKKEEWEHHAIMEGGMRLSLFMLEQD